LTLLIWRQFFFRQGSIRKWVFMRKQLRPMKQRFLSIPTLSLSGTSLGSTYLQAGELTRAIASFRKSIEIDAKYIGVHYNLAGAYERAGEKN